MVNIVSKENVESNHARVPLCFANIIIYFYVWLSALLLSVVNKVLSNVSHRVSVLCSCPTVTLAAYMDKSMT